MNPIIINSKAIQVKIMKRIILNFQGVCVRERRRMRGCVCGEYKLAQPLYMPRNISKYGTANAASNFARSISKIIVNTMRRHKVTVILSMLVLRPRPNISPMGTRVLTPFHKSPPSPSAFSGPCQKRSSLSCSTVTNYF